jgi:hypothetical protein
VSLRFADGSRLLVVPESQVTMEELLVYGRTGVSDTRLRVDRGATDTRVVPNAVRAPAFEIRTPAVNLGVRGTDFRVHVAPSGEAAQVEVLEGRVGTGREPVAGAPAAAPVLVDAGFGSIAERDQPVRAPQPLLPAPRLTAAPEVVGRLTLAWTEVSGARAYRAQVFLDGRSDALLLDEVFHGLSAQWPIDAGLPDGRYLLRVRAIDASGLEGLDASARFALLVRPVSPALEWPRPGAVQAVEQMPIRWVGTAGVARYRLQVAEGGDFASPLRDTTVEGTETTLALAPGVYSWRVAGIVGGADAPRQGAYGETNVFDLRAVPELPVLEPAQFAPGSVLLRWKPLAAGQGVQLQLAEDPAFERLIVDRQTWAAQLQLARPAAGRYHLRLRSVIGDGPAGGFGPGQVLDVPGLAWWERLWADAAPAPR